MSWLLNSTQLSIAKGYLLLDIAQKICSAVAQTYSQVGNNAQFYEIRKKIHEIKQGELNVAQYYDGLSNPWQELDYYQDFQAECPSDIAKIQKLMEKERVFDFLARLNVEHDQVRVQILGKDPFPSLMQSYSFIQQEESHKHVMLTPTVTNSRSAMTVNHPVKDSLVLLRNN